MPIPFLAPDDEITAFPAVDEALEEPNGLLMAGGSLSPQRLLSAYQQGIFPWYEEGEPILWWSPDPRCIIVPERIRITRSLKKTLRGNHYEITENTAYRDVMKQCGAPRANSSGTWVTEEMIDAYCALNRYGLATSVEVWMNNQLAGGLYGIALGEVFIGESMFSRQRDASKIALVHLAQCDKYKLIDCQLENPHLLSMGAESISRSDYLALLQSLGARNNDVFSTEALRENQAIAK
jgi:leucyl/phenylalanyl-tRNA--protein transferase